MGFRNGSQVKCWETCPIILPEFTPVTGPE